MLQKHDRMGSTPIFPTNLKGIFMLLIHLLEGFDDPYCDEYTSEFLSKYVTQLNKSIINHIKEHLKFCDKFFHTERYVN